ncbi:MAG: prolyl-tRNA synthetase associated domain-containing protein [Alphaproteobacteria bacterium]|nr:prolyl-tRNA synthetase associated domain-containing protein [Alphaproteobacteria bacterium]
MPHTAEQLFSFLDRLGIEHQTMQHPPIFNAADGRDWEDKIPGVCCKNLFLKDGKGQLWLIVMPAAKRADLSGIAQRIGAPKLSFAKPDVMLAVLGLTPGSVTPFALLNDKDKQVRVVLDEEMLKSETVNYHPLHNAASTTLRAKDFLKFIAALGYKPIITECGNL